MTDIKTVVLSATEKLLRPLVRILIRYGISHVEVNELLKKTYVEVAYQDYSMPGVRVSTSRIAVLSGMSRKEVTKWADVIEKGDHLQHEAIRRPINRASRVISGWMEDKDFITKAKKPRIIPITDAPISFKTLVGRYSGDVTYGAILDELIRIEAVEIVQESKVKLVSMGYIPKTNEVEKINIMGTSVADLLITIDHNSRLPDQPRIQRETIYTDLSPAAINEFRVVSREKCQSLLLDIQEWLANKKKIEKELSLLKPGTRTGIGLYFIGEVDSEKEV